MNYYVITEELMNKLIKHDTRLYMDGGGRGRTEDGPLAKELRALKPVEADGLVERWQTTLETRQRRREADLSTEVEDGFLIEHSRDILNTILSLQAKVRELEASLSPPEGLIERLIECKRMIGKMCSEGRPPLMRIPLTRDDEDRFIIETCNQAIAALRGETEGGDGS